jgi:hypothetical protein
MAEDKRRTEPGTGERPADAPTDAEASDPNYVRPAGPKEMQMPQKRRWTKTDEEIDESFPASDPPGNY